jgi:hypothetical protein
MSEEEDLVGTDIDRAIRAAMMSAGQVAEAVKRAGQERDRNLAERAQAAVREQAQVTRSVHDQVGREAFWATANGERVANAATYGATLSSVDPGARDVYEIVREQAHARYGIDVDSLRAQFPDSEDKRRDALMHAVDDYLAASREEAAAQADRAAAAPLEQEAAPRFTVRAGEETSEVSKEHVLADIEATSPESFSAEDAQRLSAWAGIDADVDKALYEQFPTKFTYLQSSVEAADAERGEDAPESAAENVSAPEKAEAQEAAQDVSADAANHDAERDRLHADGAAEETIAHTHEQESAQVAPAAAPAPAAAAVDADGAAAASGRRSGAPTSTAGKASQIAATSYPKGASQTLTESRKVTGPKARVNRGSGPQKERGKDLGR